MRACVCASVCLLHVSVSACARACVRAREHVHARACVIHTLTGRSWALMCGCTQWSSEPVYRTSGSRAELLDALLLLLLLHALPRRKMCCSKRERLCAGP